MLLYAFDLMFIENPVKFRVYSCIFTHCQNILRDNLGYSRIFYYYLGIFGHIQGPLEPYVTVECSQPCIFRIVEYSTACHMQNLTHIYNNCIFRILAIIRMLAYMEIKPNAYLEFCQTSKIELFLKIIKWIYFQNVPCQMLDRDLNTSLYALACLISNIYKVVERQSILLIQMTFNLKNQECSVFHSQN